MKLLWLVLIIGGLSFQSQAQVVKNPSITAELLGAGIFNSLNVEAQLGGFDAQGLRVRAGIGGRNASQEFITVTPFSLTYLLQVGDGGFDYIEFGGGYTILNGLDKVGVINSIDLKDDKFPHAILGYRMIPNIDRGVFAKISATPLFAEDDTKLYGGLGIGYMF